MLTSESDDAECDMFFDSLDRLSSGEWSPLRDELSCSESSDEVGFEIWMNQPSSVEERRQNFLRQMGLADFASNTSSKVLGLDRLVECNAAVSRRHMPSSDSHIDQALECCTREEDDHANFISNEFQKDEQNTCLAPETVASSPSTQDLSLSHTEECRNLHHGTKKMSSWWNRFVYKRKERGSRVVSQGSKPDVETRATKIKVLQKKKRCLELTAPYVGQEICAHNGFIWTMKFSPDGQYLATGGEDGVVRVWHVRAVDAPDYLTAEEDFCSKLNERKFSFQRKHPIHASVVFPDKVFHIEESPIHEFYGHSSDVLDLAWSNSNCVLSASKDKTVRLWQLGCDESLNVFHHNDYVTCIHFNPVDDNYFISGSIDGKVRIWGLAEKRVVDWTDVGDVITAICYQPDGQGFVVGSITGTCRSYKASYEGLLLNAQIHIRGKKKTAGNKITGIKFSQQKSQRVMISSEDSKLRIFNGVDLTCTYKGLPKSGSQMSASFTSSERHIISLGADSRVYIWDHDISHVTLSNHPKSVRSCEHFLYEGVSVAIPWSGLVTEQGSLSNGSSFRAQDHVESASRTRESEHFSLGSWFSMDGAGRGSATWPEEKLPLWEASTTGDHNHNTTAISETWGLVIVAAGSDGTIRTFHNYGLPVRL